ncbi:hypothetical protein [Vibrio rumoiensis]|uniref:Uncharacterized protein n=1 Tax=Vibrio rumoiensis 1S-45 TaxID=1188252 RepID=A0A1E5E2J1_9VIBR|nr:hypothetical protein [Vibrio rumoiensis]OEF25751.1 hypothetical protein A1QC_08265 [Vibrio rumoiensis 1S-45]
MLRLITLLSALFFAVSASAEPKTLSDQDVARYFVCSYLHTEDSYKIGSYLIQNYEIQWYTYSDTFKALVSDKLSEIAREQNVSKFKAEDELSNKYQCNSAYIELIGLKNIKI